MNYTKVLLKSRTYEGKPYRWSDQIEECKTYVFRDKKFEDFMLRALNKVALVFPTDVKYARAAVMSGNYYVCRSTDQYRPCITVSFAAPNEELPVENLIWMNFHPEEDIVHIGKDYYQNKHALVKNGKLTILSNADFHILWECRKAMVPTRWQLRQEPDWVKNHTVQFIDLFNLYASRNPTVDIEEA